MWGKSEGKLGPEKLCVLLAFCGSLGGGLRTGYLGLEQDGEILKAKRGRGGRSRCFVFMKEKVLQSYPQNLGINYKDLY